MCLVGAPGVGKTSLVRRFVEHRFEADYHSTIGVRIDRATVTVGDEEVSLIIWDIHGEDDSLTVRPSYLTGMAGFFVVIDAARPETVDIATELHRRARSVADVPAIAVVNKSDLVDPAELAMAEASLASLGEPILTTSCLADHGVDGAFADLAAVMLGR